MDEKDKKIEELTKRLEKLERNFTLHQHTGFDDTRVLNKTIRLDKDEVYALKNAEISSPEILNYGAGASERFGLAIACGRGDTSAGVNRRSDNMQVNLQHNPNGTSGQISFFNIYSKPIGGTGVSVTSGGSTVSIPGFGFATNELANQVISIFNSSGVFVETRLITSNTSSVVTITDTWGASTSNASFLINFPAYLGSGETIFQRGYFQEGAVGGVRFGMGVTAGAQNQNGLLYMDAAGDLYWRNKTGTSTKLN